MSTLDHLVRLGRVGDAVLVGGELRVAAQVALIEEAAQEPPAHEAQGRLRERGHHEVVAARVRLRWRVGAPVRTPQATHRLAMAVVALDSRGIRQMCAECSGETSGGRTHMARLMVASHSFLSCSLFACSWNECAPCSLALSRIVHCTHTHLPICLLVCIACGRCTLRDERQELRSKTNATRQNTGTVSTT